MRSGTSGVAERIEAARAGDREALEGLLDDYRNYLGFLARTGVDSALRAKAGASDVVQDTLLAAFEHFGQFRGACEGELVAWLRRILARKLAMLHRRYRRTAAREMGRERAIAGALDRSSVTLARLVADSGPTPSRAAAQRERGVLLADALARLSEDHREAIELRNFRQLGWDEAAASMGRSPEAVRKLWARAVSRLGRLIEGREL
jgi:RNA polymerase sigma-70 factor (ECF subfamily)